MIHDELTSDEGVKFINLLVMDPDLLDSLEADVKDSETEYNKCLRNGKSPQERDACDKRAERRICETLNRIKDRNDDDLVTDYLRNRWKSYRCIRY